MDEEITISILVEDGSISSFPLAEVKEQIEDGSLRTSAFARLSEGENWGPLGDLLNTIEEEAEDSAVANLPPISVPAPAVEAPAPETAPAVDLPAVSTPAIEVPEVEGSPAGVDDDLPDDEEDEEEEKTVQPLKQPKFSAVGSVLLTGIFLAGITTALVFVTKGEKVTKYGKSAHSSVVYDFWKTAQLDRWMFVLRGEHYQDKFGGEYGSLGTDLGLDGETLSLEVGTADIVVSPEARKAGWKIVDVEQRYSKDVGGVKKTGIANYNYLVRSQGGEARIEWEASKNLSGASHSVESQLNPKNWKQNRSSVYEYLTPVFNEIEEYEVVDDKVIVNFPETLRGKSFRIQGYFTKITPEHLPSIPGVSISSKGLVTTINITNKDDWFGFQMIDNGTEKLIPTCFAQKEKFGREFLELEEDTPIGLIVSFQELPGTDGKLGAFCLGGAWYNIFTGEWKMFGGERRIPTHDF